jgi:predicted nucleotidyltransferase
MKARKKGMEARLIEKAKSDKDVAAVILFGSAARKEEARDVDVCLVLYPDEADKGFDKRVEYSTDEKLDVQVFQDLPLYIRIRVLKEGKILLCKDDDLLYDIAASSVREFEYFRPRYEEYLEGVLHG